MAAELFIDTSAWVALAETDDNHHAQATQAYPRVVQDFQRFVTTNLLISESYTILRREVGHTAAHKFLGQIRSSSRLVLIYSDPDIEARAEAILRQYDDHDFSYADAVSFAIMQERAIKDAFAFDNHFRIMGFALVE